MVGGLPRIERQAQPCARDEWPDATLRQVAKGQTPEARRLKLDPPPLPHKQEAGYVEVRGRAMCSVEGSGSGRRPDVLDAVDAWLLREA